MPFWQKENPLNTCTQVPSAYPYLTLPHSSQAVFGSFLFSLTLFSDTFKILQSGLSAA